MSQAHKTSPPTEVALRPMVRPDAPGWWWRWEHGKWTPGQVRLQIWHEDEDGTPELVWWSPGCGYRVSEISTGEWYPAVLPNVKDQATANAK